MTTTNLSSTDLATALDTAAAGARKQAAADISVKINEMLDWRERGLTKKSADDFLSGLVAAWEILTDEKWNAGE